MSNVVSIFKNQKAKVTIPQVQDGVEPLEEEPVRHQLTLPFIIEQCALIADGNRGMLQVGDLIRKYGEALKKQLQSTTHQA